MELQKQPQEIKRELKNAREELAFAKNAEDQIEGDQFAEAIEVNLIEIHMKMFLFVFKGFSKCC